MVIRAGPFGQMSSLDFFNIMAVILVKIFGNFD
jgi:hypothetical protein